MSGRQAKPLEATSAPPRVSPGQDHRWLVWACAIFGLFLAAMLYPLMRDGAVVLLALTWLGLWGLGRFGKGHILARAALRIKKSAPLQNGLLALSAIVVLVGGLELAAQILTRLDVLQVDSPMITMLPEGAHDWRLAHITADKFREPDPVLFWRPVARKPYTKQRFRGPIVDEGPSPATYRIFCYGDSNTDGPTWGGGWPEQLQRALDEKADDTRAFEVVNAGVAGYSSHQGLLRMRQEIDRFRPDLILVSFGWNDAAGALGVTDRGYRPPSPASAAVQRILLKYRFFLAAKRYYRSIARESVDGASPKTVGPRVSRRDYRENLEGFLDTAKGAGSRIVFLTRPHQHKASELAESSVELLRSIPRYNEELRAFSRETGAKMIDVQQEFERAGPDYFSDEAHFTLDGHGLMAKSLVRDLSRLGVI